ncbi:MAG TPA: hypothetical protein VHC90_22055 [Bryobacteraceae bacterium]|nr:hypothetical protein [Bryobacteraceae bacterium]
MRAIVCFALALAAPVTAFAVEGRPVEAALADVHRVYVDQLGGGKTSDQFRDMLISSMQSTGLFVLTENPERADATLKGSGDDLIYTDKRESSDSIGVHANAGESSSSRARESGVASSASAGLGVSDNESDRVEERRHEATGSVRLVDKNGDVIWSTTQESDGGKFRSAMADVADKIVRQLADETRKMRDLAAEARNPTAAAAGHAEKTGR